jgi:uncharacterized protein (DUF58 family)
LLAQLWQELWTGLFVVLILIGVFSGQSIVIGFGAMGLLMTGVSWLWARVSLDHVTYERILPKRRVVIGESAPMRVVLTNRKPVPLAWVRTEDDIPDGVTVESAKVSPSSVSPNATTLVHRTSIGWYERVSWSYSVKFTKRGYFRLGPVKIDSGDMFGLFDTRMRVEDRDAVLVYPRVVPLPDIGIPGGRPLGDVRGGARIFQDPSRPAAPRDYVPGDPLNTIDWKATARSQRLRVRTFEPSANVTVVLAVSVETSMHYWQGYSPVHLERAITAAASLAAHCVEQGYSLGFISNGVPMVTDRPAELRPSRHQPQLKAVLETLATLQAISLSTMANHLEDHMGRMPSGATVLLVTANYPEELHDVLERLRGRGHPVSLVYVGEAPAPVPPPGVVMHDIGEHLAQFDEDKTDERQARPSK